MDKGLLVWRFIVNCFDTFVTEIVIPIVNSWGYLKTAYLLSICLLFLIGFIFSPALRGGLNFNDSDVTAEGKHANLNNQPTSTNGGLNIRAIEQRQRGAKKI